MLRRLQLVELEDLSICPAIVRDYGTDYLQFVQSRFRLYAPMVDLVEEALVESGETQLVDLCAGGGGPTLDLVRELRERGLAVGATLTDRFPNRRAAAVCQATELHCRYHLESVDARSVPRSLEGVRIVCNAFHHFAPADAKAVLRDAVAARRSIAVLEIPERTARIVLSTFLAPFMVMAATPWLRPFRWSRLLLTYGLPAVPLLCLWDGVVSQLRAYSPEELTALADEVDSTTYRWKSGKIPHPRLPLRLTYLIGHPADD